MYIHNGRTDIDTKLFRTIDECHQSIVTHYHEHNKKTALPKTHIDKVNKNNNIIVDGDDISNQKKYTSRESERKYYLDTSHYLYSYYHIRNGLNPTLNTNDNTDKLSSNKYVEYTPPYSSILNFINNNEKNSYARVVPTINDSRSKEDNRIKLDKISKWYRKCIDKNVSIDNEIIDKNNVINTCVECGNTNMVISQQDSNLQCNDCGACEYIPIVNSTPSFKKARTTRPNMTVYKRINHFNDWISQFQAKESFTIPPKVYRDIYNDFKKYNNASRKRITKTSLRKILRKLGYTKYYEHIPRMIQHIHGVKPPSITHETEQKMRILFKKIQDPFNRHSSDSRKNFLSYSFVLHKFVGLLKRNDLKSQFPLLKSRVKLYQQDVVWRKICRELNWKFEPSI